jgi:hypothetical protein
MMSKHNMKKSSTETVAWISLATTVISVLWNVFFGYGTLVGKIDALQVDLDEFKAETRENFKEVNRRFEKIDARFEKMEDEFHKTDI